MDDKHPLQQFLTSAGYTTMSYSGRMMFGKQCLALVINPHHLGALIADVLEAICRQLADEELDPVEFDVVVSSIRYMRQDDFGLDRVYYFPDAHFVGAGDDEGDDPR